MKSCDRPTERLRRISFSTNISRRLAGLSVWPKSPALQLKELTGGTTILSRIRQKFTPRHRLNEPQLCTEPTAIRRLLTMDGTVSLRRPNPQHRFPCCRSPETI